MSDSSYKVETAVNILRKLGIKLSDADIRTQLADEHGFFRALVRLPAQGLKNGLILQQVEDMQHYVQNRIVNIVFANYTVAMKQGKVDEEGTDTLSGQMLAELQSEFEQQAGLLEKQKEEFATQILEIDAFCRAKLKEWQALQKSGSTSPSFTQQMNTQVNAKMLTIMEKFALYQRSLQSVFSLDRKTSGFCSKFPDADREREIERAEKVEPPEIEQPAVPKS